MFCLSKGLGAPVGSMLLGSAEFIAEARIGRKLLGGGMRQAGILAAAGLIALEESPKRLHVDHENARALAQGIAPIAGVRLDPVVVETNIVIFDVKARRADGGGDLRVAGEEGRDRGNDGEIHGSVLHALRRDACGHGCGGGCDERRVCAAGAAVCDGLRTGR